MSNLSTAMELIEAHYGTRRATRSGVRLMNHIHEGIAILRNQSQSDSVMAAFALHPLLQADQDLLANITKCAGAVDSVTLSLALQYRDLANSYLCTEATDHWTLEAILNLLRGEDFRVLYMLYADKKQNFKDFALYHLGSHPRSPELHKYFNKWIYALEKTLKINQEETGNESN